MQAPSLRIKIFAGVVVVFIASISAYKYWPKASSLSLVTPSYEALQSASSTEDKINISAFLQSIATTTEATSTDDTPDTVSRNISRTIFANTAFLENANSLDDSAKSAIVSDALSQIQNSFSYKSYEASGLPIIQNRTQANIRFYGSSFANAELQMVVTMQNKVKQIEGDLSVMADIYEKQADALYAISVPKDLADTHLEIVNNFSKAASSFRAIANEKDDPLKVPVAISVYQSVAGEQDALFLKVAQYLKDNGIIYTKDEAGGYWNSFATQ